MARRSSAVDFDQVLEDIFVDSDNEEEPRDDYHPLAEADGGAEAAQHVVAESADLDEGCQAQVDLASALPAEATPAQPEPVAVSEPQTDEVEPPAATEETASEDEGDHEGEHHSHECMHDFDASASARDDTKWTRRNDPNPPPEFTAEPGLVTNPPDGAGPEYYINLFLEDNFFDLLVVETNRYAQQCIASQPNLPPSARARQWKNVTAAEIRIFIALYFLTRLTWKSQLHTYWSTDALLHSPIFPASMSRNRFTLILQFLHFVNNATADKSNKLYKVQPLMDVLLTRFKSVYVPQRVISVDEELVLFKGRLQFKQYNPSKRSRFGIKIFALCDVKGYYFDAIVYTGKPAVPHPHTAEVGASGAVVLKLLGDLKGKGYTLFLDNWYIPSSCLSFTGAEDGCLWYHASKPCGHTAGPESSGSAQTPVCVPS